MKGSIYTMLEKLKEFYNNNICWIWDIVVIAAAIDVGLRRNSFWLSLIFYFLVCITDAVLHIFLYADLKDFVFRDPIELAQKLKESFSRIFPLHFCILAIFYVLFR